MKHKLIIGPHHGEYAFKNYSSLNMQNVTYEDSPYIDSQADFDKWKENYPEHKQIYHYWEPDEGDNNDWGQYTALTIDFTEKDWKYEGYINDLLIDYTHAFMTTGGDDSTFDYMPSYTDAIASILIELGEQDMLTKARNICLAFCETRETAKTYEFFTDDELNTLP
jgi:hypothetical protein